MRGNAFTDIDRVGKLLIFFLDHSEFSLVLHLKMTGQLIYPTPLEIVAGGHPFPEFNTQLPNKFTHVTFVFADGTNLFFNDLRQFGYLQLVTAEQLTQLKRDFGLEPNVVDFTWEHFASLLAHRQTILKAFLLNQKLIAGLGNIYADESAFAAGLRPDRKINTLTEPEAQLLYHSIKDIIARAIDLKGTTFRNYTDSEGKKGGYAAYLQVYGRAGETCLRCGQAKIQKIKLAGRGTHFCPHCQK
jgi:formamidopyrimidine-DNA glycosylase